MIKKTQKFVLLFIFGTIFLIPNFYRNAWHAVDTNYYDDWQTRYDRFVIARLVQTRQDGFFSYGGFLGLGDIETLPDYSTRTNKHQYNSFINNDKFISYAVYKSNPGGQGVLYGGLDKLLSLNGAQKINFFRGFTSTASALVFGLIYAIFTLEFGALAGVLMLFFSAVSIWTVLPAGSIFWNLWAFFLPFIAGMYLLANSAKTENYRGIKIYIILFVSIIVKILLGGFDLMTTTLIMSTAPIVFYSIQDKWSWKTFVERFIKISAVLSFATVVGLVIMSLQIASVEENTVNVFQYIENRFGHHFAGNSEYYLTGNIAATKISVMEIVSKYITMPAINVPLPGTDGQILYWHLIVLFATCTAIFFLMHKIKRKTAYSPKAIALISTTWYSMLAPLSWYIIFRPHSIIHTHVNTMGWQMPFTLLGFALCGFVFTDLFKNKAA